MSYHCSATLLEDNPEVNPLLSKLQTLPHNVGPFYNSIQFYQTVGGSKHKSSIQRHNVTGYTVSLCTEGHTISMPLIHNVHVHPPCL